MRTHPDDKLLEQHCHKSAAGLLQYVRFYVCVQLPEKYKNFDVSEKTHRLKVKTQVESLKPWAN